MSGLEALKYFQKAADQGYPEAQVGLASLYYEGNGVKQDYEKALQWYKKAAAKGHPEAQFYLGLMYHNGEGTDKNDDIAKKYLKKAYNNCYHREDDIYKILKIK